MDKQQISKDTKRPGCSAIRMTAAQGGHLGALMRQVGRRSVGRLCRRVLGYPEPDNGLSSCEAGKLISFLRAA